LSGRPEAERKPIVFVVREKAARYGTASSSGIV